MVDSKFHIDDVVLTSFAKEAKDNIGFALSVISKKIFGHNFESGTEQSPYQLLMDSDNLLPEQKISLQKCLIQAFPSVRIVLDFLLNRRKDRHQVPISYPFPKVITICRRFFKAIACISANKDVDPAIAKYLVLILNAAPNTLRSTYKYDRYKNVPCLLPEDALIFFEHNKINKRENKTNPDWFFYPATKISNEPMLNDIGKIELISLFLAPNRVFDLLESTKVLARFKSTSDRPNLSQKQIVQELFSCYSIRIPKQSIIVAKDSLANALDIIQCLRKCPEELFPVLPPDIQARFNLFDSFGRKTFLKRTTDCFPNLLLNYFDSNKSFENIRFGLHLGYVSRNIHSNKYADGNKRDRYVKKNINCFCSLREAHEYLSALQKDNEDIRVDKFSFIRNGSNFALSIGNKMAELKDGVIRCPQPDCWISQSELVAMAFYEYLCPGDAERIIIDEVIKYRNEQIKKSKRVDAEKKATNLVAHFIEETESLIHNFNRKKLTIAKGNAKLGCKRYARIMADDLAAFLVRDIIFWMDSPKPTGLQYAVLKGMFANFDGTVCDASQMEQSLRKIGIRKDVHVVLRECSWANDLMELYDNYLKSRRVFLQRIECKKILQKKCERLAQNETVLQPTPVLLPRHIFFEPILRALREKYENNIEMQSLLRDETLSKQHRLSWLLNVYFELVLQDKSQSMYLCHRRDQYGFYRLLVNNSRVDFVKKYIESNGFSPTDREIFKKKKEESATRPKHETIVDKESFLTELYRSKKHMMSSERAIRRHRINDMILFLLANRSLNMAPLKLHEISPEGESESLNLTVNQNLIIQIGNTATKVAYQSSIRDSYLLYKWISDSRVQDYLIRAKRDDESVMITSNTIKELISRY